MTPSRIDESANSDGREGWHCQSWGAFTVDLITRVLLRDEGTHVFEDDGDTDYDERAFAMCEVCQRQAPVSSFRCEPVMMDDAEGQARAGWTRQGVDHATLDQIVADFTATPQPGAWVGPFQIPDESPIVGRERTPA